ncbi:MAG: 3-dehydroquinate synthase [Candidatus Eremiobacterota bacterium]
MPHPYLVEPGLLTRLRELVPGRAVLVTDSNVQRAQPVRGFEVIVLPAGEEHKTLDTVRTVYARLVELEADRQTALVAVGGGVVGDLAGFAAATFLRGLPFYQVPTSLLAMVDASIGGKTGVDLPEGKNLVGAFHLPQAVYVDPEALSTLPEAELSAGMAEVLKHGLIADPGLFQLCLGPVEDWPDLIRRAARVKLDIVRRDPLEHGERAYLNLGHTLGHALETAAGYRGLSHGEAVGLGLLAAVSLASRMGRLESVPDVAAALRLWGLPTRIPRLPWEAVRQALKRDKKRRDGRLRFVLPVRAGKVELCSEVPLDMVKEVFQELCEP